VVPEVDTTQARIRVTYDAGAGGVFYNGLYPGESDPVFTLQNLPSVEVVLEEGVDAYDGTRDATIYEGFDLADDLEDNSNGAGEYIFSGNTSGSFARRSLLAFDLSPIPDGASIISASLQLTVSKTISGNSDQALHRLLADWGEGSQNAPGQEGRGIDAAQGDATWTSSFHNQSIWLNPGAVGDYDSVPSATATVGNTGATAVWMGPELTRDVQDWADGALLNFGWILIGDETAGTTAKRFLSSDDSTALESQRPRLTVRYLFSTGIADDAWQAYR
jgi:hypothetical protein